MDDADDAARRRRAIVDGYRLVCICNKVRLAVVHAAIHGGATTLDEVRRRTRAGGGPCRARRCGPKIAAMLAARRSGGKGA